ncbi:hypothetical protein BGZ70_001634, partial [Mortierella alpina]
MTHSSSTNKSSYLSATTPERCISPLLHGSLDNFQTQATTTPEDTSSLSPPRRVHFAVPEVVFTIDDESLLHTHAPATWEPSPQEHKMAVVGARNAHALIRKLETSTTIWTSALIAELCRKNDVQNPQVPFTAFVPPHDDAADRRIQQYKQAVVDCEKEAKGVKRALRGYAPVFDRYQEFGGSNEDTVSMVDSRYIFHGEFTGQRPKRRRRASPSPAHSSEEDDPNKENTAPPVPSVQEPEEPPRRRGIVPDAERCTL